MPNKHIWDPSKLLFFVCAAVLLFLVIFMFGMYSALSKNFMYRAASILWNNGKLVYHEIENYMPGGEPIHFLQPSRGPGSGVTVNERADDGNLILMVGFFDGGNELRLVRRDGSPVARWPVSFQGHFPDTSHLDDPPQTDRNVDLHGAALNPDGSIVFNYEHSGTVRLSRCNETEWILPHPTHHSVEKAEGGGYWIPGFRYIYDTEAFPPFTRVTTDPAFRDDLILRVTEDGAIAEQVSVAQILYDNGLEPLMTAGGYSFYPDGGWERELVHLNKIAELSSPMADAFPEFDAGDLLLSLRGYNLLLVVDPDDWRVKWHQTGPWRRQHDPRFNPDGTITVFNNNVYRFELGELDRSNPASPRVSNIMRVDPTTGRTEVAYGGRAGQELLSVIRGQQEPTPEGGFLITEFEAGRVLEVDPEGRTVWEYINRYDDEQVLEVTGARLYPSSYFTVDDWSCPTTTAKS
jgi:Arylsulfotransferase (ASST)